MKKILSTLLILASILHAQIGIGRNLEGVRVPTANTLEQGFLFISGSYETINDGHALAMNGYSPAGTDSIYELDKNTPSSGGAISLAFGVTDNFEFGASLPLYYEGEIEGTDLDGFGIGDFLAYLKYSYPIPSTPVNVGFLIEATAPTGAKGIGFRPRHQWYIYEDEDSYAFTAGKWALLFEGLLSININDILYWNSYMGYLHVTNSDNHSLLWGSGFELFPKKTVSGVIEVTAETQLFRDKFARSIMNDVFRVTPAVKIHLPNMLNLMLGMDVGFDFVRDMNLGNSIEVHRRHDGRSLEYNIRGTPEFSMVLAITKTIDFSRKDSDNDGVIDREDLCPNTELGVAVNTRGCPVDLDLDGVMNFFDDCPGTPHEVGVDYRGCPIDSDNDSVPDYIDICPNTPVGTAVDSVGCIRDSDNDGVDDNRDRCPNSLSRDKVDEFGCPLDDDHDGVLNERDSCPETPRGYPVDIHGCPLDFDKDGVPDEIDMCPNSHEGEIVDDDGCPADNDHDGVPDSKDECNDTPVGFPVDQNGCPSDHDHDSIPDATDKCPNTPAHAPVDSLGCPIDTDGDGILDYLDKCPGTFLNVLVGNNGCPLKPRNNLNSLATRIKFKNNSDVLLNSSYTALNDVIYLMRKNIFILEIQCSSPSGQEVSEKQAQAIVDYLVEKGIDENRIKAKGYGTKLPQGEQFKHWNSSGVRLIPYIEETAEEQE
jgi:hypothetical protein